MPFRARIDSLLTLTMSLGLAWGALNHFCLICTTPEVFASELRKTPFVLAVQAARSSVVNLEGKKSISLGDSRRNGESRDVHGMGTGVVIDERGFIVTNYHVVDGVHTVHVTLHDQRQYTARLIARDPETDLAIIKIDAPQALPLIKIGTATDLMPGEPVIAVGNAYGYEHTVTRGIVSALHRHVRVSDTQEYHDLIQTDAGINPGNSGGPLLNADGEMVGINVAVRAGAHGIGFAIPVDIVMTVAARLLNVETLDQTWHGVVPDEPRQNRPDGVVVKNVIEMSPAESSGLLPGDVIKSVGEHPVAWALDFERALLGHSPGDEITLTVQRHDKPVATKLVLAAYPGDSSAGDLIWSRFGALLEPVKSGEFEQHRTEYHGGLLIKKLKSGSVADEQGMRVGDVLVGMHIWQMVSRENVEYVLSLPELSAISPVKFYLIRDGMPVYGFLPLSRR